MNVNISEKKMEWFSCCENNEIFIFPYIRKPDIISSNTYIIETPDMIIIIDPGADIEQTKNISNILSVRLAEKKKMLLILLTHCHYDHSAQIQEYVNNSLFEKIFIAGHTEAAAAISSGNKDVVLADFYNTILPQFNFDFSFSPERQNLLYEKDPLSENFFFTKRKTNDISNNTAQIIYDELYFKTTKILEIFYCPGHSPDGIIFKIGSALIIGDILFAANPMIAGSYGWNKIELMNSFNRLSAIINIFKIDVCYSGHGNALNSLDTLRILKKISDNLSAFKFNPKIDSEKISIIRSSAIALLNEADRLFTIISGQLLAVAYKLDELEEYTAAENILKLLDIDNIEKTFIILKKHLKDYQEKKNIELVFVHNALISVQKIKKLFLISEILRAAVNKDLIDRADSLLKNFLSIAQGSDRDVFENMKLNSFLCAAAENSFNTNINETIDKISENDDEWMKFLIENISKNIFKKSLTKY